MKINPNAKTGASYAKLFKEKIEQQNISARSNGQNEQSNIKVQQKGIKFDDWDDKDGKLQVVISNKKGIKLYDSRKKLARYLATKLNHTAREIEEIIEIEGCEKINEMHSGYRCCYLLFDKWLLVDDNKSNKYIGG